jgi:hypothetical protein
MVVTIEPDIWCISRERRGPGSSVTWENELPHSGSPDFADTEEVTGSNPVAPTRHHRSSGRVQGPGLLVQSPVARPSGSKRAAIANEPAGRPCATGAANAKDCRSGGRLPWGKGPLARGSRCSGDSNSIAPSCLARGQAATGRLSCGFFDPLATGSVHDCPPLPPPLRTQRGPRDRFIRSPPSPALGTGIDQARQLPGPQARATSARTWRTTLRAAMVNRARSGSPRARGRIWPASRAWLASACRAARR